MAIAQDIYSLVQSPELPTSPASELKNAFKNVFQQALQTGPVSITRNRKREAILLSADLYDKMVAEIAARDPLVFLQKEYEAFYQEMQTEKAAEAYEHLYNATPEQLGRAAVQFAGSE